MPVVAEEFRALASVEVIREIQPIEGADAIVRATVKGWNIVVKIGEFQEGDKVVYFEEDTALPVGDPRFAFLASRGVKSHAEEDYHVLKIARLRGVYSQGLVLPVADFPELMDNNGNMPAVGSNVTSALGLGKWEAEVSTAGGAAAGLFPGGYVSKTDSVRVQNLADVWDTVILGNQWFATEKIDGTSLTVICDHDGNLRVCSRNLELKDGDNLHWNIVRKFNLGKLLSPGEVIQAEIAGPGVQKNRQGIGELRPLIFTFVRDRVHVPMADWPEGVRALAVPVVDIKVADSVEDMLAIVDGMKSTIDKNRLAEGVVFHSVDGREFPELGGRSTWKVVSPKYLTKG